MDNDKTKIDISSVDAAKLPHKDRLTELKKTWYKFSLNKMSVCLLYTSDAADE